MTEPPLQSSPFPKGDGNINRPIAQWLCFNFISTWFFSPRAAVPPVVNSSPPEPSHLDPPLLHTPVPPSFIKLLNPRIKKEREKAEGEREMNKEKKYRGDGERVREKRKKETTEQRC